MRYFFLDLIHAPEDIQYDILLIFRLRAYFLLFSLLKLLSEKNLEKDSHNRLYEKQLCKKRKWEIEADQL